MATQTVPNMSSRKSRLESLLQVVTMLDAIALPMALLLLLLLSLMTFMASRGKEGRKDEPVTLPLALITDEVELIV